MGGAGGNPGSDSIADRLFNPIVPCQAGAAVLSPSCRRAAAAFRTETVDRTTVAAGVQSASSIGPKPVKDAPERWPRSKAVSRRKGDGYSSTDPFDGCFRRYLMGGPMMAFFAPALASAVLAPIGTYQLEEKAAPPGFVDPRTLTVWSLDRSVARSNALQGGQGIS